MLFTINAAMPLRRYCTVQVQAVPKLTSVRGDKHYNKYILFHNVKQLFAQKRKDLNDRHFHKNSIKQ